MHTTIKKITAFILSGVMVVASGLAAGQIKAKETDKLVNEDTQKNISEESAYILECKNSFIYDVTHSKYAKVSNEESTILQNNNIITTELTEIEVETLEKLGVTVESDICVTGSGVKDYTQKQNEKRNNKELTNRMRKAKKCTKEYNWNIESLGVDGVIDDIETDGEKVKIAILDSGIDYSESINVVKRKNFIDDEVSPLYEDNTGHGTAIAGIIASNGENGTVKGINPDVEIYSARILDTENKASMSKVVESIYWAIGEDVDIINISFGTTQYSEILHNAIKEATAKGILVFAASGNQGENEESTVEYPAAFEEVVAVGATNPAGEVAEMTSRGKELDILAPGINIHSIGWLDMEVVCSGTSMAVPHAVGVASLLWQKDKSKSADFIKGLIAASAKTVKDAGEEYSYIDVAYAEEIYDEYDKLYGDNISEEILDETYENTEKVKAYDETVTGSWSKKNHEDAVEYAYNIEGGLTSTELAIVKLGSRAPDDHCPAKVYSSHRMFHALDGYNYVKVYEYIMNMSLRCKNYGHNSALAMAFPDNNAGIYGECATVRSWLGEPEIRVMLTDKYKYNKRNTSLMMLGIAMHVVGDTYAHQFGVYSNGIWQDALGENDNINNIRSRWKCTKEQYREMLEIWNGNSKAYFLDYIQDYKGFRLKNLSYFSELSPNGLNFEPYRTVMDMHSY